MVKILQAGIQSDLSGVVEMSVKVVPTIEYNFAKLDCPQLTNLDVP